LPGELHATSAIAASSGTDRLSLTLTETRAGDGRFAECVLRHVRTFRTAGESARRAWESDGMDAVMLVGGKGTRLRPLTMSAPKPMLPAAGVPITAHQLARARDAGVDHVILATSYRADVFRDYFGDGSDFGLELEYVHETEPLGTGGGIRNVADRLRGGPDSSVIVFNGDVLTALDLRTLVERHEKAAAAVTLYLTRVNDPSAFGLVPTDDSGRVTAFLEKPTNPAEIVTDQINAGCYVFRRSVLESIPAGRVISVERDTFPGLLADGQLLMGHVDTGYWLDLGTPADFVRGSADLVAGRAPSSALPGPTGDYLALEGAQVHDGATVFGGTSIGRYAIVSAGAVVEGSVLFDEARIEPGARVRNSVIGKGAVVGSGSVLDGVVVGDEARVGGGNELLTGVRIFPGAEVADGTIRFSSDR
jgi:mannose-1-phosphate guanylyltransferase